ncbi:SDR family NAD(P)-dependent oxidoreductase [Microlunatus sp. GCM10028923]|uniref:SDR family NAD(P)-dependent oxidoreductase n=1 Tax=Microlunatus sp. GCM10028923 TaxID=3273400 RepID=UPI0036188F9E
MTPFDFGSGTAIVTGAAGGIGEQLAYRLAERGLALALVDRDADRLDRVAAAVRERTTVTSYVTDLADGPACARLAADLAAEHPDCTLLINNAGVALVGDFEQVSAEEFDWVLAVNLHATVTLCRALVPVLRSHPGSHLVNLSSLFGLIAPAGQAAYATSKYAVRGFTESLRAELAPDVGVTVVHPGGIRTGIARSARRAAALPPAPAGDGIDAFDRLLTFPADRAATMIIRAVERRRPRLLIGASASVPDLLARITPGHYPRALGLLHRLLSRGR